VIQVRYDEPAYSFLASTPHLDEVQSVLVDDLEIHVDVSGRVLYVDGYSPRTRWVAIDAVPPVAQDGEVRADIPNPVVRGSSVQLIPPMAWSIGFNRISGWLCVGDAVARESAQAIRIQPGIILVLNGLQLVAIWLRVRPIPAPDN